MNKTTRNQVDATHFHGTKFSLEHFVTRYANMTHSHGSCDVSRINGKMTMTTLYKIKTNRRTKYKTSVTHKCGLDDKMADCRLCISIGWAFRTSWNQIGRHSNATKEINYERLFVIVLGTMLISVTAKSSLSDVNSKRERERHVFKRIIRDFSKMFNNKNSLICFFFFHAFLHVYYVFSVVFLFCFPSKYSFWLSNFFFSKFKTPLFACTSPRTISEIEQQF